MKTSLILFVATAACAIADTQIRRDDLFRLGFTPPELIKIHLDELGLNPVQSEKFTKILGEAEAAMPTLQASAKELGAALESAVTAASPDPGEAEAILNRLLEAEASGKRLQFRTILGIHGLLSPEQRAKALELAKKDVEQETSARKLAERFRTAIDGLGVKPTQAMQERGDQIKPLLEAGKFAAALEELQVAAKEFGLDEPLAEQSLDFSQYSPGITELTQLQQRYNDVEQRIQRVRHLPLLKQLIQAHAELEGAKSAQDAMAVGRILTWAEGVLPPG